MKLLDERFAASKEGDTHLVTIKGAGARRRKVLTIVERAGVESWADTWQTLRRSCEVEWASQHPQYAVSRWIGHSITVSGRHYANSVPAEVFAKVTGKPMPGQAAQNAAQQPAESRGMEPQSAMPASASVSAKSASCQTLRNEAAHSKNSGKWSVLSTARTILAAEASRGGRTLPLPRPPQQARRSRQHLPQMPTPNWASEQAKEQTSEQARFGR